MNIRLRQDAILRILRRNGTVSVSDLARDVGASRRTILRDIGALRDQGFVIDSECGRGGGLQFHPETGQSAVRLSVTEIFALMISVAAIRAAKAFPFSDLADVGLAKIERTLPANKVRDLRRLLACLYVGQLSPTQDAEDTGAMDSALLPTFETAFLSQLHLRFMYLDARGVQTRREVEPQAMLILPPLWYLVAWDPGRAGFRHFRMDRISLPEIVEGTVFRRRHVPFEDDVCPYKDMSS